MPDKVPGWLVEIEDAIERIRTYTNGVSRSEFLSDALRCDATALQLIVIGEAARKLPTTCAKRRPRFRGRKLSPFGIELFTDTRPSITQ